MRVRAGLFAARLTAFCCCAAFALLTTAGCTSSTPTARATPSVGGSFYSGTARLPSSGSSSSATSSASASSTPSRSAKSTTSPSPSPSPAGSFPTAAPPTGGGGTAGFQHAMLAMAGAAAMLAGLGSLLYRRRLKRHG